MTLTASQAGRKPYCNPKVPTFAIDRKLGWVHVATSPTEVEEMVRAEIARQIEQGPEASAWTASIQAQTVRYALWRHARNLEQYWQVMG